MDLLKITKSSSVLFYGEDLWPAYPNSPVFGGQLIAQSLLCALQSEENNNELFPLSYHINFHRPTSTEENIKYSIKDLKKGKTIITKSVEGYQNNKLLFTVEVLLSKKQEIKYEYIGKNIKTEEKEFKNIKEIFAIENLHKNKDLIETKINNSISSRLIEYIKNLKRVLKNIKIEFGEQKENIREYKFTLREDLQEIYRICMLALVSDFFMLEPALNLLHGKNNISSMSDVLKNFLILSLDHKLHFMRFPGNTIICRVEIIRINDTRILSTANIFDENKQMIASAIQEGMIIKKQ